MLCLHLLSTCLPHVACPSLQIVRGVGGFDFDSWRRFKDERRSEPASGFIDGDLVEAVTC
jgi:hypothetical protein